MRRDAGPSVCDVAGCTDEATGTFLHARDARLLEFGVCSGHYVALQSGERPVVASDRVGPGDPNEEAVLILE